MLRYEHGSWYGPERYVGLHYDLHAGETETDLGTHATPEELVPAFQ